MPHRTPPDEQARRYSRTGGAHGSGGRDFGSSGSRDFGRGAAMHDGDRDDPDGAHGQSGAQAGDPIATHRGHRGKGPAGYQRSDQRLREDVCQALTDDDRVDATHIAVVVVAGEVTLAGTVDDRQAKRRAEECAERVPGVREVHNQLRVDAAIAHELRRG